MHNDIIAKGNIVPLGGNKGGVGANRACAKHLQWRRKVANVATPLSTLFLCLCGQWT